MVNSWKIAFATMVIFCCGVVTGALVTRQQHGHFTAPVLRAPADPARPGPLYQLQKIEFLRKLEKHLDLTADQQDRIEKIMRQSQERTKGLWDQIAPQMREELKKVREDIRAELTPGQKKKFETLLKARVPRKEEQINEEKHHSSPQQTMELPLPLKPLGATN